MNNRYDSLIYAPFGIIAISVPNNQLAIELIPINLSDVALSEVTIFDEHLPNISDAATPLLLRQVCTQIQRYLQQPTERFSFPELTQGTVFQQRVWQAIATIPVGEVRTYSQLAAQVGSGSRAVANACGANPLPIVIPCHRVVAKNGLGGFMQGKQNGLKIKQWLLKHEGVNLDEVAM